MIRNPANLNRINYLHILTLGFDNVSYGEIGNRPGVAGAVLQSALSLIRSFIDSVSQPFPQGENNSKCFGTPCLIT